MSKLNNEVIKWSLEINGNKAMSELNKMEQATRGLRDENKNLKTEMAKLEAQGKKNSIEYKQLNDKISQNNQLLKTNDAGMSKLRKEVGLSALTTKQLRQEYNRLGYEMNNMTPHTAEWRKLKGEQAEVGKRLKEVNTGQKESNALFSKFMAIGPAAAFTAIAMGSFSALNAIKETRKEFERYEAMLRTATGSQAAANMEMGKMQEVAKETPFQLSEVTESYIKMVNQGFKPTKEEMISLGDMASAQGKSFEQMVEAFNDATVGFEFERLKELGVLARTNGDQVTFTFKGIATTVDKSSESVRNYLLGLGKMDGIMGSMADQMKTLAGQESNLADAYDDLLNTLGKGMGIFSGINSWLISIVSLTKEWVVQSKMADNSFEGAMFRANQNVSKYIDFTENVIKKSKALYGDNIVAIRNGAQTTIDILSKKEKEAGDLFMKLMADGETKRAKDALNQETYYRELKKQITDYYNGVISEAQKARDAQINANAEAIDRMQADYQKLVDDFEKSQMTQSQREILSVTEKYDKQIKEARDYYSKLESTNKEGQASLDKLIVDLEVAKEKELTSVRKKIKDERKKKEKDDEAKDAAEKEKEYKEQVDVINKRKLEQQNQALIDRNTGILDETLYKEQLENIDLTHINNMKLLNEMYGKDVIDLNIQQNQILDNFNKEREQRNEELAKIQADKEKKRIEERIAMTQFMGEQMGDIFSSFLLDSENSGRSFLANMQLMLIEYLEKVVNAYIAEIMAKQIASKGVAGIAAGAVLSAVVKAAFSVAKSSLKTKQAFDGRYDVVGEKDGRTYRNVPYAEIKQSQIVSKPTLISERGGEMILTASHVKNLQFNYPALMNAIMATRVPQRAEGKYDIAATQSNASNDAMMGVLSQLTYTLNNMQSRLGNLQAKINYEHFTSEMDIMDTVKSETRR